MFSILDTNISDAGFYINLDSSVERRNNVEEQIHKFNIQNLNRFSAITNPFTQSTATMSHCAVFEMAKKEKYKTISVFEDDFQLYDTLFVGNEKNNIQISEYLPILIEHMQNIEWDIICLGFNGRHPCIPVSKHLSMNFKSTGAWGYIIKERAYLYILEHFDYHRDRLAIDDLLPVLNYHGFKSLATNTQIVHHGVGFISTLQPSLGPINYSEWILGNYYRTIWHLLDSPLDFDDSLNQIFDNSEFIRNNTIRLNNFDGNVDRLIHFMKENPRYAVGFNEIVDNYSLPQVSYYLGVECPYLIHPVNTRQRVFGLDYNIVEVDL